MGIKKQKTLEDYAEEHAEEILGKWSKDNFYKDYKTNLKQKFVVAVKSDAAKEYWFEQLSLMMKEYLEVHFSKEYLNNSYNNWLEFKE